MKDSYCQNFNNIECFITEQHADKYIIVIFVMECMNWI